eukprot:TRINITY_DN95626_c0_g1_i1.p1 TRINITY_DN95626_c0_g1~~TRINITY_DN95626_c0_g1_i1.p1  ORF type:complete len:413 (+),score=120.35 TRINITY_DN95626_c0_g1_i1:75-1313(+)
MGSLLTGQRQRETEEVDDTDDDTEEGSARDNSKVSGHSHRATIGGQSQSPVLPDKFSKLQPKAAAVKKKFQAPMDVSKLTAARAATKVVKPSRLSHDSAANASVPQAAVEETLPRGSEGAGWEALEDCVVRAERDIKSVRLGALQHGERCVQTGPWRADPNGRVRMPMKGPRQLEGWVTLDARRCRNAEGSWGNLCFKLCDSSADPMNSKPPAAQAVSQHGRDREMDDFLDFLVGSDAKAGGSDSGDEVLVKSDLPASDPDVCTSDCKPPADQQIVKASTAEQTEKQGLSETQRQLRAVRKKLREVADLEARSAADLGEAQREKVARKADLQQQEADLMAEAAGEERAAKRASGDAPRRRKKPAAERKAKQRANAATERKPACGSLACLTTAILPVSFAALAFAWQSELLFL